MKQTRFCKSSFLRNTYEYIVGYMKNLKSSIWDHKSNDKIRDPHVVVFSRSGLFIKNKFLEVFTIIWSTKQDFVKMILEIQNTYEYIVGYMKNFKSTIWHQKSNEMIRYPHLVIFPHWKSLDFGFHLQKLRSLYHSPLKIRILKIQILDFVTA